MDHPDGDVGETTNEADGDDEGPDGPAGVFELERREHLHAERQRKHGQQHPVGAEPVVLLVVVRLQRVLVGVLHQTGGVLDRKAEVDADAVEQIGLRLELVHVVLVLQVVAGLAGLVVGRKTDQRSALVECVLPLLLVQVVGTLCGVRQVVLAVDLLLAVMFQQVVGAELGVQAVALALALALGNGRIGADVGVGERVLLVSIFR